MRSLRIILLISLSLILPKGWHLLKGPGRIHLGVSTLCEYQPPLDSQSNHILAQPFSYWGKGSQFYAFISKDRKFVLKIPRSEKVSHTLLKKLFLPSYASRSAKKLEDFLQSLKITDLYFREETGIIHVQYGKNYPTPPAGFSLTNRLNQRISIHLKGLPFVLQQRGEILQDLLKRELQQEEKKAIFQAFLDLIVSEQSKGWMCNDKSFLLNVCYSEGRAIRIDIGSYLPVKAHFSLKEATRPVCHWLKNEDPDLLTWFEHECAQREFFSASSHSP